MKPNFSHFLGFTIILFTLVILSANAQEGIPGNEIPDLNFHPELQDEKPLLFEPDRSTSNNEKTIQGKEQLIADPKSSKSKSGDSSKNPAIQPSEDDALSFNFLYYIIQKFKISDIVAQ
jgi:hypothetical protein